MSNQDYYNNAPQEYRDTRYTGPDSYSGGDDFSSAAHHASEHHSSEDRSFFDNALGFLQERKGQFSQPDNVQVDESHALNAHQALYGGGGEGQTHDSGSVGAGAAVEALKMFTSGGSSDGGFDKNKLIGLAMAQAGKLWDEKQGSGANMSGDKQSAINNAAETALKMYLKGGGGVSGTGGPSDLLSLASKFF
ncbi:hypothetical protein N7468_005818 [Penicillium chermesinum]|uniref:DUF7721 domain-containing protein n=1 Tax=Penicillium chermesinum TaxID=63820 RepID=A0A9W9P012_9EURO|nr:uncharacterized protein N7468_005818 [Penicillium chermesinum]KAJ5232862.1 hypothetical protein N7468_005818 [Penicillium chermesinum]KAJ6172512.1 hypothetical protein N7470_001579 [Penicillium chermesinum]